MHDSKVGYCQGMNFLAGLFYFDVKDEAKAFARFTSFLQQHQRSQLYVTDVPLLKAYFHQLNRLMALHLPDLHLHFCKIGITAQYFSSAWLLTNFTYFLQHGKDKAVPSLMLRIFTDVVLVSLSLLEVARS
jgi:hypothetical protein